MSRTSHSRANSPTPEAAVTSATLAEWTLLVYMAGDNNLDAAGGADLLEMKKVGSTERVHVVVQRDSAADGAHRYYLHSGTTVQQDELAALGTINTGDPRVLEEFLIWGLTTYPAKRSMAVLWNHGHGWDDTDIYRIAERRGFQPLAPLMNATQLGSGRSSAGFTVTRNRTTPRARGSFFITAFKTTELGGLRRAIAFDDGAQDFLDSVELKNVFTSVAKKLRRFDVIGMDACLMSMLENGLQVQAGGDVFCGSQEVEPGDGWPYERILGRLTAKPTMTGNALARMIVHEFAASYPATESVTQSAFDLASLTAVQKATDALGERLMQGLANPDDLAVEGALNRARRQCQKYEHPDYVDLWDFTVRLAALWPGCGPAAEAVQQSIGQCVFANASSHPNVSQSHGLSIYLPVEKVNPLYSRLDMAGGGWAGFLRAFKG